MHPGYFGIKLFFDIKKSESLYIFVFAITNASKNHRLNVSIRVIYKESNKIKKKQ